MYGAGNKKQKKEKYFFFTRYTKSWEAVWWTLRWTNPTMGQRRAYQGAGQTNPMGQQPGSNSSVRGNTATHPLEWHLLMR